MKHALYGVANWFIRLAIEGQIIKVFGDGLILRDFLYIDDCVEALILSALSDKADGEILNVGHDKPISFIDYTKKVISIAGSGSWEFAPFTAERKAQEPGDFYSDITKINKLLGWQPKTGIDKGIERTTDFYQKYKKYYW